MKKILGILFIIINILAYARQGENVKQIKLNVNNNQIIFELNSTKATEELYNMLPLKISIKNYSNNEKVFDIDKNLNTENLKLANPKTGIGTLAYFKPWNNIVIFYGNFNEYPGLYELGEIVQGKEYLKDIPIGEYIL